ncbi:hypothetical protein HDA40_008203 [Hamadaea flava]|uniref:Uncharacterized protein n=1 Tax=Hamadaea flava TaxID=1742688 RepID=A0ABV8LN08_9ACTN|nr:hypothetical protein [Hamadaea flava]MCP2329696.1 hypothetical protein [Hamadaea flava]
MRLITKLGDRLLATILPTATADAACAPNEQTWYTCETGHRLVRHYCYTKTLSGGTCQRVCTTSPAGMC